MTAIYILFKNVIYANFELDKKQESPMDRPLGGYGEGGKLRRGSSGVTKITRSKKIPVLCISQRVGYDKRNKNWKKP